MVKKDDYATFGKVLINLQYLETIIKLYASLFKTDIKLNKKYRISKLNSKNVLADSDGSKSTLGSLMRVIKTEIPNFDNNEFDKLLEMRNTFVHNFHKEYLSVNAKKEDELSEFVLTLNNLTDKYTKIFTGLVSLSVKFIAKGAVSTDGISDNEKDLIEYIIGDRKDCDSN